MTLKLRMVTALVRLYPAAWRREYGPELTDMLLTRPLSPRIISDVLRNGLRQRIRTAAPSTLFGLAVMLVILTGFLWNIAGPPPNGRTLTDVLRPSSKTLPTVTVTPLASDIYVLMLVWCGCWTHLRDRGKLSRSGVAAMRLCVIAGIPVMVAGVLMLFGILGTVVLEPGQTPTTFHEHGLAYTYYGAQHYPPTPLGVLVSPLFRLPESWLWGVLGGVVGRWMTRLRHGQAAGS
jgi:hypothetical protein